MDLISVIVPVYNVEPYLMRCVDSIRNQTFQNLEIILVDDESPDRCPEICEEIKQADFRVKVIHKKNGGLGFARNSGLEIVTGDYVTFIDSDDWISEDHIENLYNEAKRTGADVVIGGHTTVDADGAKVVRPNSSGQRVYEGADIRQEIVLSLIGADVSDPKDVPLESSCCMNLYRCDIIREHKICFCSEKEAVSEDMFFNIDFFCNAKTVSIMDEVGYFYFENLGSISRKYDPKCFDRTVRFYQTMKERTAQFALQDEVAFRIERTFLMKVRVAIRLIVLSDLPGKEKIQQLRTILDNQVVKKVLAIYPIDSYIPAIRVLMKAMYRGNVPMVFWLFRVREYAKKTEVLKNLLKRMGIGK